jgi:uncharacterized membrane protein
MHPFDLKTVLLAKHAQHVVLVHFPIALYLTGVAFDLCAYRFKKSSLAEAAYFNFIVAAFSTVPVVISGVLAWQWQLEGQRLKGILLQHLVLASVSSMILWLVWWVHRQSNRSRLFLPGYRLTLEILGVILIALTGHLGGYLSGVNGLR